MSLESWIRFMRGHAGRMMRTAISPLGTVKRRSGFGQTIRPARGAVVASPVLGDYDPEPDYFFHWFRDSALVMDAMRLVPDGRGALDDFIAFSRDLRRLDGRGMLLPRVRPDFRKFLRADLAGAYGDAIAAEARVNADGSLDISDWPRPQYDGPALRALTLLRWGVAEGPGARLLRDDLDFVRRHAAAPGFDIWEEERGDHYYPKAVAMAALADGAAFLERQGDDAQARHCRDGAAQLEASLEGFWRPREDFIASRPASSAKALDASVILAANHARLVPDARMMATLDRLEALFRGLYPINRGRAAAALGRYAGDSYYGGGAWYVTTLAAAELCYRAGLKARGDDFLETVRAFTPESGDLSEQFDGTSGKQTSARHLAWSYAAFLTAAAARDAV